MGELLIIRWRDYSKPAQWKARWFVLLALTGLKSQGVLTSKPTLMEIYIKWRIIWEIIYLHLYYIQVAQKCQVNFVYFLQTLFILEKTLDFFSISAYNNSVKGTMNPEDKGDIYMKVKYTRMVPTNEPETTITVDKHGVRIITTDNNVLKIIEKSDIWELDGKVQATNEARPRAYGFHCLGNAITIKKTLKK